VVLDPERSLAAVLFTDIVGSTEKAAALGDRVWRGLLHRHHAAVRRELRRHGGREIATAGDGFLSVFDHPAAAIVCACAIRDALRRMGIEIRGGIHAGQVERSGRQIGGIAVHIGQRVAAAADPGQVLVSGTVRDLEVGSGFQFEDRGVHHLKGVPGEWRLFAVTSCPPEAADLSRRRLLRIAQARGVLAAAIAFAVLFVLAGLYVGIFRGEEEPAGASPDGAASALSRRVMEEFSGTAPVPEREPAETPPGPPAGAPTSAAASGAAGGADEAAPGGADAAGAGEEERPSAARPQPRAAASAPGDARPSAPDAESPAPRARGERPPAPAGVERETPPLPTPRPPAAVAENETPPRGASATPTRPPARAAGDEPAPDGDARAAAPGPAPAPPPAPAPAAAPPDVRPADVERREVPPAAEDPEPEIRRTLSRLQRAIVSEDLGALREVWPELGEGEARNFEHWFDTAREIRARFDVLSLEPEDDGVRATVQTTYEFFNESTGREATQTVRQVYDLRERGGSWVVLSGR
jgi:class 3 adenylate cyclase